MPNIIAIANQKGGVGKTTTAINLAAALADRGHPTLLVDMDPQGNATSSFGVERDTLHAGVLELLHGELPLAEVAIATPVAGLDLLPATLDLVGADIELAGIERREHRLKEALAASDEDYDFIIVDCPPSLGFLNINALTAATSVLIPVQAEYFAMEGLGQLITAMHEIRRALNPGLIREGLVMTMHDSRLRVCHAVEDQIRGVFGDEVFETMIPRNVRLSEAPSHGQTVFQYDPRCRGAQAYRELAKELVDRRLVSRVTRQEAS